MSEGLLMCRCSKCGCEFYMNKVDVTGTEEMRRYLTCPLDGRHKVIKIVSKYDNYKRLMEDQRVYKKTRGKIKQIK